MVVALVVLGMLGVLTLLWVFASSPNISRRERTFALCEHYFAHRGLHDNDSSAPENSLFAFNLALEYNMGIELDVRRTKDNVLVVAHDDNLKRVAGVDKNISDITFNELSEYKLFNSDEKVPMFSQALELVNGKVPLIIEVKDDSNVDFVCEKVSKELDSYKGTYCVESFNPLMLKWFRKNRPDVIRGQLSTDFSKEASKVRGGFFLTNLLLNFLSRPDFIAYDQEYRKNISIRVIKKLYDIPFFAWTVKSQEMLYDLSGAFEAFIFEGFLPEKKMI